MPVFVSKNILEFAWIIESEQADSTLDSHKPFSCYPYSIYGISGTIFLFIENFHARGKTGPGKEESKIG